MNDWNYCKFMNMRSCSVPGNSYDVDGYPVEVDGYVVGGGAICWDGTDLLVSLAEHCGVLYCASNKHCSMFLRATAA